MKVRSVSLSSMIRNSFFKSTISRGFQLILFYGSLFQQYSCYLLFLKFSSFHLNDPIWKKNCCHLSFPLVIKYQDARILWYYFVQFHLKPIISPDVVHDTSFFFSPYQCLLSSSDFDYSRITALRGTRKKTRSNLVWKFHLVVTTQEK